MNPRKGASIWLAAAVCLGASEGLASEAQTHQEKGATPTMVTIRPEETDELLANPHVGWQTFHRTKDKDRNLPAWIPSTVQYARWGWGVFEPQPGKIDHAFLDKQLAETRAAGQTLAFRVMCCSTRPGRPYHPDWLVKAGGKEIQCSHQGTKGLVIPDLDDPVVLERHVDFIRRLGERYDGHRDIDHVDLGSVGWWGEWHMSGCPEAKMPTPATCKRIVDAYLAAFRKTRLLMLIGGGQWLSHAAKRGAGWRADCLGDMGGFSRTWCHMRHAYPTMSQQESVAEAWKTAPVAWESCWDMRKWVDEGWPVRFIFNYALALHGSYLNNKSAPLPKGKDVRPELERFLRRLGYRLVLKELRHPPTARAGRKLTLSTKWQNAGSAPCYRPYRLAWRLTGPRGRKCVLIGGVTVERWMPGSVTLFTKEFFAGDWELPRGEVVSVSDAVGLPANMAEGTYKLSLAVVAEDSPQPVVRLGIQGRARDGWYPLSEIEIRK
jgi:hypothetical protein